MSLLVPKQELGNQRLDEFFGKDKTTQVEVEQVRTKPNIFN
jgi:hypothetical protein